MPPKTRNWTIPVVLALIFGLCSFGAFAVFKGVGFAAGRDQIDKEHKLATSDGIIWRKEDVAHAIAPIPDSENSFADYSEAIDLFKKAGKAVSFPTDVKFGQMSDPNALAKIRPAVTASMPSIEKIRAGNRKPKLQWKREYTKGFSLLLPEFAYEKSIATAMDWNAVIMAADGSIDKALAELKEVAMFASHMQDEPIFIGQLVRIGIEAKLYAALTQILSMGSPTRAQLAAGREVVQALGPFPQAEKMLVFEPYGIDSAFDSMENGMKASDLFGKDANPAMAIPAFRNAIRAAAFSYNRKLILLARQYKDDYRTLKAKSHDLIAQLESSTSETDKYAAQLIIDISGVLDAITSMKARRTASIAAFEAAIRSGTIDGVSDIALPPTDPFTYAPMIFAKMPHGFKVYSVGPDLKDDGGLLFKEKNSSGLDVGFRLGPDSK